MPAGSRAAAGSAGHTTLHRPDRLKHSSQGVASDPYAVLLPYLLANLRSAPSIRWVVKQVSQLGCNAGRGVALAGNGAGNTQPRHAIGPWGLVQRQRVKARGMR